MTPLSSTLITPLSPKVDDIAALGRLIRAQRLAAGLRIDDAAALCGVSVAVFSRLENGGEGVSVGRVFKILDALGLSVLVIEKSKASQISISLPTSAPI